MLAVDVSPSAEVPQGTFMGLEVYWGAIEAPGRELKARIELLNGAGEVAQAETRRLYPDWPSDRWPDDTLVIGRYRVRVDADLPPGPYQVRVGVVDADTGASVGPPSIVESLDVQPVPRSYAPPQPGREAGGCFDDTLCLLGYDVARDAGQLALTFYWQAERTMEHDYVLSTRIVDSTTPSVAVWSHDAAPREWQYPTTWWDAGEVVSETVTCPLDEVPEGQYRLGMVVYEPNSGAALPVTSTARADTALDQILLLESITVP
jgi:hypothetical protein